MSRVVEKNEEQMQYHLNSSCFSSEVMVEIQVRIQWSGGKRLSGQVKVHNWCNIQDNEKPVNIMWKMQKTPFLIDILTEGDIVLVKNEL